MPVTLDDLLTYMQNTPELAATEFAGELERREYDGQGRAVRPWPSPMRFAGVLQTLGGLRYRVDYERCYREHEEDGLRESSFLIAEDGSANLYFPRSYGPPGKTEPDLCAIFSPSGQGFGQAFFQPHELGFAMHPRFLQVGGSTVEDILLEYQEYGDFHSITNEADKIVFRTTLEEEGIPRYTIVFDPARNWLIERFRVSSSDKDGKLKQDEESHLVSTFAASPGVWLPRETRCRALLEGGGYVEARSILTEVKYEVLNPVFMPEIPAGIPIRDKRKSCAS